MCAIVLLRSALHDVLKAVQCIAIGCDLTLDDCGFVDQWDAQATVKRINESLIERGYVTWFDLTNMKGELQLVVLHPFAALQLINLMAMQEVLWTP